MVQSTYYLRTSGTGSLRGHKSYGVAQNDFHSSKKHMANTCMVNTGAANSVYCCKEVRDHITPLDHVLLFLRAFIFPKATRKRRRTRNMSPSPEEYSREYKLCNALLTLEAATADNDLF